MLQQNVPVSMKDGVVLYGDLYRPAVDGKLERDVKWPVVLIRTPLNKNEVSPDLRHPGRLDDGWWVVVWCGGGG